MSHSRLLTNTVAAIAATVAVVGLACGGDSEPAAAGTSEAERVTLRLGYFPNITHAPALVGVSEGTFAEALGANVDLETVTFNAGPSVIEALFAGQIDASYIGPNPAINGYVRSNGEALRIVAGATSGGALLIVRSEAGIEDPGDLAGRRIATPQLGNTQDVALRIYLAEHGLAAREQGGDVEVTPTSNADTLSLFSRGDVDAAWVPEPWATRLIQEAGGEVFLDERELWPDGDFVTTHLIVRTEFLDEHPDVVERLVGGHVEAVERIAAEPEEAKLVANEAIGGITSAPLPDAVIDAAWQNLEFTYDPLASTLFQSAADAFELGFLGEAEPDLAGIYALDALSRVLAERGLPAIEGEARP